MRALTKAELELVAGGYNTGNNTVSTVTLSPPHTSPPNTVSPITISPPGGGGGGGGGGGPPEPFPYPCHCMLGHAAGVAETGIKGQTNYGNHESYALLFQGGDGDVYSTPVFQTSNQGGGGISEAEKWMTDNGVALTSLVGEIHNHPYNGFTGEDTYGRDVNRYPSPPQDTSDHGGDWATANNLVSQYSLNDFATFIIDPYGVMREYDYSDESKYINLTFDQRSNGVNLPTAVTPSDNCTC